MVVEVDALVILLAGGLVIVVEELLDVPDTGIDLLVDALDIVGDVLAAGLDPAANVVHRMLNGVVDRVVGEMGSVYGTHMSTQVTGLDELGIVLDTVVTMLGGSGGTVVHNVL